MFLQENGIKLISLHNEVLKTVESKILEFLAAAEVVTQVEKCDDLVARFILKYFSDETGVKTSKCDLGLKVTGKQTDIDRCKSNPDRYDVLICRRHIV